MKERQIAGLKKGTESPLRPKEPNGEKTSKRKELAKIVGTSEGSIQRTKLIVEKGTPKQIDRARKGGQGNAITAIAKEITMEEKGIEMKKCSCCGKMKPITEFYMQKNSRTGTKSPRPQCKPCYNKMNDGRKMSDVKGNRYKIADELKGITEEEIIGDFYNTEKVVEFNDDDFKEELCGIIDDFKYATTTCLDIHKELLDNKKSKVKVLENLTLLQQEIQKWKEQYHYEEV